MSADGIAALAVDDLGRSLLGWQLAGWQFEIPHDPLTVSFLEPGAAHVQPPELGPIPGSAPAIKTEAPEGDETPAGPISTGLSAAADPGPPSSIVAEDGPRESLRNLDSGAPEAPFSETAIASDPATAPPAGGVGFADALQHPCDDVADFFEFNVIFQLNVLMDSDFVVQEIASASDASLSGLGFGQLAFTGGNTQSNTAAIADAGDYGDFGWLGGSYYETNAVYSLNALDDGDIAYNLISGAGLDSAQSITSGGNAQINHATIHSLTGGEGPVPEDAQIGPADTVEYNITTQINFMHDGDIVGQQIAGGGNGSQTASTGSNSQSNTALMVDENAAPGHDVPGNYYESNLIIQANFMDDGDHVAQIVTADMAQPHMPETSLAADDDTLPHGLYGDALA